MASSDRARVGVPVARQVAFGFAIYLLLELVAFGGLQVLYRATNLAYFPQGSKLSPEARKNLEFFLLNGKGARADLDPVLGWIPGPGPERNKSLMRDDREYEPQPPKGVRRIATFGDSFTFGADVRLGENWAKQIPAMAPSIEMLNYGVGAYGLDQAYLRYLQVGADFHPHVVLIGYMTENLARDVNVYRGFYSSAYRDTIFSKPRFELQGGVLQLIENPLKDRAAYLRMRDDEATVLRELGTHDYHYAGQPHAGPLDFSPSVQLLKLVAAQIRKREHTPIFTRDGRYEEKSEAYEVTAAIFDAFEAKVIERGAVPIIVILPDTNDQERSRKGIARRYDVLLNRFRQKGYRYIDTLGAFEPVQGKYSIDDLTEQLGHYSKLGNSLVARYILDRLSEWGLDQPASP